MRRYVWPCLTAALVAACPGAAVYEFRPTPAPLRYAVVGRGELRLDSPVGEQRRVDSIEAVVRLEIGPAHGGDPTVAVSFETLDLWVGGDFGELHADGGGLIGRRLTGRLTRDGAIRLDETPEIPAALKALGDPAALFVALLPPLPPRAAPAAAPWPHRIDYTRRGPLETRFSYDGTASLAGDTTWQGRRARVIVTEGLATVTGRGSPAGGPGEVAFTYTGRLVKRHVWDPRRGLMLAASRRLDADGELEARGMGLTMPVQYHGTQEIVLLR